MKKKHFGRIFFPMGLIMIEAGFLVFLLAFMSDGNQSPYSNQIYGILLSNEMGIVLVCIGVLLLLSRVRVRT